MKNSKLPVQSAPVERHISGAAVSGEKGVEASGIWDILKTVGSGALQGAIGALG